MQGKKVKESRTVMCHEAIPMDTNSSARYMHGGDIMKLIDNAAGVAARRHCRTHVYRVVTVAADNIEFLTPVHVGNLIIVKASLNYTGRTSIEVAVNVDVENLSTGEIKHVSSPLLTMIAIDKDEKKTTVPSLIPVTKVEKMRFQEGKERALAKKQKRQKRQKKRNKPLAGKNH